LLIGVTRDTFVAHDIPHPLCQRMVARRIVGRLYNFFLALQVATGTAVVIIGAVLRVDANTAATHGVLFKEVVKDLQQSAWVFLPTLLIASGLLGLARKILSPPWLWQTVHTYLDVFRADVFDSATDGAYHHHRVTLFRYVKWRFSLRAVPWAGWLVPVERSGHTTQSHISCFLAPDDADRAEGIAGKTWARNRVCGISNLPDLSNNPSSDELAEYAEQSGLSVHQLRKKMPKTRSMFGIPVEVKGNLWGVIVVDSRSPDGIKRDVETIYRPLGKFLPKLLERV
jgi:hypothetical protein